MRWLGYVATLLCTPVAATAPVDDAASVKVEARDEKGNGAPVAPTSAAAPSAPARPAAAPMAPEVKALVDRMQAFYEKTADFVARFEQSYRYQASRRTQTSSGTVTFKKPALMRWEYQAPSPRTFVLAGEKIYAHDPQAKTLTVASIGTNQLSASVTFLWGKGRLADEFAIRKTDCKDCKGTLLELDPLKPDPRFKLIRLEVDPKSAQVLRSTVVDPDGSENTIRYLDLKTGVGVDKEAFKINPPADTQVIDYTQQGGAPKPTR